MEEFMNALGAVSLTFLIVVGALAGYIAGRLAGRNLLGYMAIGVAGAVALPFLLAALGIGLLAIGGLFLVLVVAAAGAAILLVVARKIFD